MPRAKREDGSSFIESEDAGPPKRVRITHYKIPTSIGRLIAGNREFLPAAEANDLISKGYAVEC